MKKNAAAKNKLVDTNVQDTLSLICPSTCHRSCNNTAVRAVIIKLPIPCVSLGNCKISR